MFRFFDITKIGLIKKSEKLKGGYGIMADDILAGIFAFIINQQYLSFNQSLIIKFQWANYVNQINQEAELLYNNCSKIKFSLQQRKVEEKYDCIINSICEWF